MELKKISHIGIAVADLAETSIFYRDVLGMKCLGEEEVAEQKVKVAMFAVGESKIELLMPTSPDSPIQKFLDTKGQGIHHIAYQVNDIQQAISEVEARGLKMIDSKPRIGAGGTQIAFIHPKSSERVLTELIQYS